MMCPRGEKFILELGEEKISFLGQKKIIDPCLLGHCVVHIAHSVLMMLAVRAVC
jgi:hypothetical protein